MVQSIRNQSLSLFRIKGIPLFLNLFLPPLTFVEVCKVIPWYQRSFIQFTKQAITLPIMGIGRATTRTPEMAHMPPITLPRGDTGAMSPYPT